MSTFDRFDAGQHWLADWRFTLRPPAMHSVIEGVTDDGRSPHEIMEDLRREDPDAHALLSEHLVIEPGADV